MRESSSRSEHRIGSTPTEDGGTHEGVPDESGRQADADGPDEKRPSQAAKLVRLAADVDFFVTPEGQPFATIAVNDRHETHPVRSRGIRGWLRREYWRTYRGPVSGNAVSDAVETLAARAEFDGEVHPVSLRIARHEDRLYVDLANPAWEAIEINPAGWRLIADPPVPFRRTGTMAPLPTPIRGGSIEQLRPFVNVAGEDGWHLFVGALVAAFAEGGPYFVLVLLGEQGSAKSTSARVFRELVDPSRSPLRAEPADQRDLLIAAKHGWVIAIDNVSHLSDALSDAICRLSTGGGFSTRTLYTDEDETVLDAQRPVVLTAITDVVRRGDLLDRAVVIDQPPIADTDRLPEAEFWRQFELVRPAILGALCDALVAALATAERVALKRLPRMADPTRWVTSAEAAFGWPAHTFANAYARNRHEGNAMAIEASVIAAPLQELVEAGEWLGTAGDLLQRLSKSRQMRSPVSESGRRHREP